MSTQFIQDDQIELDAIKRRQALADSLRQQAMSSPQGQMVSGRYVPAAFTQQIQPLLAALASHYTQNKTDADTQALTGRINTRNQNDLSGFVDALRGKAAQPGFQTGANEMGDEPVMQNEVPAVAPDRNKALGIALGSKNPMLQTAGGAIMKDMIAGGESQFGKVDAKDYTPESVAKFAASRNHADLVPVRKREFVNGTAVDPYSAAPGTVIPEQLKPDSVVTKGPDGSLIPNAPVIAAKSQVAAAGKPSVNSTVINTGPKEFEKELGKLDAEQLGKWRSAAETANNTMGVVRSLRSAEASGAYAGAGADAKLAGARFINAITGTTPKGMVGSELYNAESKKLVLEHIKALGANPSNADRDFIEKTVPQLATSAPARAAMANFMEQKAKQQVQLYERADSFARQNHGLGGFQQFAPQGGAAPDAKSVTRTGTLNGRKVIQYSDGSVEYSN